MTYFAIGESTGGAGERRLGPFDTPEEAEDAGKRETKDSNGGFVFKGVVDEANNQVITDIRPVSTNAVVRNAMAANRRVARNANDDPATARKYIRECLDAIYGADDSRKRALSSIASLINSGALDKSVGSKVNELQSHLEKAMVLGKEIFYQHLSK